MEYTFRPKIIQTNQAVSEKQARQRTDTLTDRRTDGHRETVTSLAGDNNNQEQYNNDTFRVSATEERPMQMSLPTLLDLSAAFDLLL